jgi:hypothetical protein
MFEMLALVMGGMALAVIGLIVFALILMLADDRDEHENTDDVRG